MVGHPNIRITLSSFDYDGSKIIWSVRAINKKIIYPHPKGMGHPCIAALQDWILACARMTGGGENEDVDGADEDICPPQK